MAIQSIQKNGGKLLEVQVTGELAHEDYLHFLPKFEQSLNNTEKFVFCLTWLIFTAGSKRNDPAGLDASCSMRIDEP